jgi:dolichol-phosphate mannosyltransferase
VVKTACLPPPASRLVLWRRYVRFCLVGASGLGVDMAVLHLLAVRWGWDLSLSKVLAAEAALLNNFLWNERWTFRGLGAEPGWRGVTRRLARFHLICLAGIGWSVLLLQAQVAGLGWNVYLANFISIVAVSVWNFGMNLKFGWNRAPGGGGRPEQRSTAHD